MNLLILAACVLSAAAPGTPAPVAPPPRDLSPGIALLPGAMLPERGPDGNTVVFDAPEGLVVVDTGRHAWHSDGILAYARTRGRPIAAIVNTHWHLDHTSGNGRIRAAHPGAVVHATGAVERALADGGFLARNLESAKSMLNDPRLVGLEREETEIFIATMAERDVLRPQVVVRDAGEVRLAGRPLDIHLTSGAVTDADLWLYDRVSGIAVIGDLVTLPAPFFETACPGEWRKSLDEVWSVPFRVAIPGHGEPMERQQFDAWRGAFNAYMDCVEGQAEAGLCAAAWADAATPLMGGGEAARREARGYAEYYVEMLRANQGRSADCLAPTP